MPRLLLSSAIALWRAQPVAPFAGEGIAPGQYRATRSDRVAGETLAEKHGRDSPYTPQAMSKVRQRYRLRDGSLKILAAGKHPTVDVLRADQSLARRFLAGESLRSLCPEYGLTDSKVRRAWVRVYGMTPSEWKSRGGPPKVGDT